MKGVLLYDKAVIRDIDLRLLDKMWAVATVTWMTMTSLAAWRDGRVQTIYGGTNDVMKEIVGKSLGVGRRS